VPIVPTLIVVAARATMVALGVWQLRRAEWKADLIARYSRAQAMSANVPWPHDKAGLDDVLFRWSQFGLRESARHPHHCRNQRRRRERRGARSRIARSRLAARPRSRSAGRARRSRSPGTGAGLNGIIGPGGTFGGMLHASPPAPGLEPLAPPDPGDLPNNHLAYAGQWFFFALTALVIYVLALRRRSAERGRDGG
jgi:surfeit locus 1 family protein